MRIGNREIGFGFPPFVIAEISCNHGGSLPRALELIAAAKAAGADAVKLQCYTPDSMTIDCDRPEFMVQDGPWRGRRLYDLYKETQTPPAWFPTIKAHADKCGIQWLASVFDKAGVDLMSKLKACAIKIASFEAADIPLIKYAADTGKPLIISNGMMSWNEVDDVNRALVPLLPGMEFMWLRCTSGYPTPIEDTGLQFMGGLYGLSDHSTAIEVPIAASALGAAIIEKHFRLSWHPDTEDSPFSLDEIDFARMVGNVKNTWKAIQRTSRHSEEPQRALRRSLYAVADIKSGHMLTEINVRSIRPGGGLPPKELDSVLGRTATRDIIRGEPLQWDMINRSRSS